MTNESNEHDFDIIQSGYERFIDDPDDNVDCSNAIITVRRQEQITTHFGPMTTQNKIKVSLSQEQIVNRLNGMCQPGIKRSQSINIQKTLISPIGQLPRNTSLNLQRRTSLRPSLIPIKINEPLRLCAPQSSNQTKSVSSSPSRIKYGHGDGVFRQRTGRKHSIPIEKQSEHEINLSSLPITMTQSMDPSMNQCRDIRKCLPDKYKCGICLNALNDARVLDCLHTFCLECLFGIESGAGQKLNKVNVLSRESSDIDMSSSNPSDLAYDSKENGRRVSRSSITSLPKTTNTIKRIFSTSMKKRPESDRKNSTAPQIKRRLSTVTEKNKVSIKCPICSCRTEISIGGVSRIPKNFVLERQMQEEILKLEKERLINECCSLCYDDVEAVGHCANCLINLCVICQEAHFRQRSTSKHNVISLVDLKQSQNETNKEQNTLPPKTVLKCYIHPTQELKLYCTDCKQVVCHNCTILLHKNHKFESLLKASKYAIKMCRDSLERNQKFFDYVNDSISKLSGSVAKIDSKADAIQKEIEQFLKDYFEALEAHKETLLRQIAKAKETKHLSVMEQQEYLRKRARESKQANTFAENLFKNGCDTEILIFVGLLQNRFEQCQKSKMSIDPKIPDSFHFLREIRAPSTRAQRNIPLYGIIATQVADPKFCTLEIEEPIILRVYRRAELRMISRDCEDRPLCHGGIKLDVNLRYKDDPNKQVITEVNDKRDGQYVIAFTPDVAGLMSLSIKVQDKEIDGSPFELCIRTLRPHSGIFHCCTFCSSKGNKTMTCACSCKMPGYNGCGHGHDNHPGRRHWSCCANVLESSECKATNSFSNLKFD